MNFGKKLYELRKKSGLSQEELAEKISVSRQTISKWELEETCPDLKQSIEISKVFNVTIDELVNNDIKEVIINRIHNTETKVHKNNVLIKLLIMLSIVIIIFILYLYVFAKIRESQREIKGRYYLNCELEENNYEYEIEYNKNFQIINSGGNAFISSHIDVEQYHDANVVKAHIEDYFKDHGGICK